MNKDKTATDRKRRQRQREKEWLTKNGFTSWEQIHGKLMAGEWVVKRQNEKMSKVRTDKAAE